MSAYTPGDWSDFFVAVAGASAALAGLLFVAISINVERILSFAGLPDRAYQTLLTLLGVLITALFGLVPGQSRTALALELLGIGLVLVLWVLALGVRSTRVMERRIWALSGLAQSLPGLGVLTIGGISLLAGSGGGLCWTMAGVVLGIVGAVIGAWVLLVEILR
jgi:hypothetical protein